jgi:hypothetical protein
MDPLALGLVLMLLGMGGTLVTLVLFSLLISLLKRLFPVETTPAHPPAESGGAASTTAAPPTGAA